MDASEAYVCPYCSREYEWDNATDSLKTPAAEGANSDTRELTLYRCECGAIVAVSVMDEHGEQLYAWEQSWQ